MSALEQDPPPAGEHIHLPGPSLQPVLLAVAITIVLLGVTLGTYIMIAGLIMTTWVTVRWIADTRRDIGELPEDLDDH